MFEIQRSGDKTSSGKIGLDINATKKFDYTAVADRLRAMSMSGNIVRAVRYKRTRQAKIYHCYSGKILKDKINHTISINSHPSATANKAIHCLK